MNDTDAATLKQRTTILLAEDDPDDVLLIRSAFKAADVPYRLEVVSDGEQGLQYLKREGRYSDAAQFPMPFLLLLDLKMPIRSGFEVLDWIRSQPELDPLLVVVLTGSDLPADVVTADQLGTNSYLVKSSDYKQLTLFLKSFAPQ